MLEAPEAIYDSIRCCHTSRETGAILSPYWPTDLFPQPWSHTMWELWRKGLRELTWAALTTLYRYAQLPEPQHKVTVTSTSGQIEVIQLSGFPAKAVILGPDAGKVTVNLLQTVTARRTDDFVVRVVKSAPARKTPRKGISMLVTTHQILRAHRLPGETWDTVLLRLCALDSPAPEHPAPPTDGAAP